MSIPIFANRNLSYSCCECSRAFASVRVCKGTPLIRGSVADISPRVLSAPLPYGAETAPDSDRSAPKVTVRCPAPLSSAATPIVDARPPALPIARPLVPLPTGRGRGRIGSVRLGSVQSASGGLKRSGNQRLPVPPGAPASLQRQICRCECHHAQGLC